MRHAVLFALLLTGPAQAAQLTVSFGGGQSQPYTCTLKDGRTTTVRAVTRGRAYRACRAWAARVDGELATVLPVSGRGPSAGTSPARPGG